MHTEIPGQSVWQGEDEEQAGIPQLEAVIGRQGGKILSKPSNGSSDATWKIAQGGREALSQGCHWLNQACQDNLKVNELGILIQSANAFIAVPRLVFDGITRSVC